MLRVISELRPTWIIGENVAGLLSMVEPVGEPELVSKEITLGAGEDVRAVFTQRERYTLSNILQDVERLGYAVRLFVFPACGVGANHRRDRIAIVARNANRSLQR